LHEDLEVEAVFEDLFFEDFGVAPQLIVELLVPFGLPKAMVFVGFDGVGGVWNGVGVAAGKFHLSFPGVLGGRR